MTPGAFIAIAGEWSSGTYGLEPKQWTLRLLEEAERIALLGGPPELREKQARDYAEIGTLTEAIRQASMAVEGWTMQM